MHGLLCGWGHAGALVSGWQDGGVWCHTGNLHREEHGAELLPYCQVMQRNWVYYCTVIRQKIATNTKHYASNYTSMCLIHQAKACVNLCKAKCLTVKFVNSCLCPFPFFHSALTISNIQPGFTGDWECRVRTSRGNNTRTVHIVVLESSAKYCSPERVSNNKGDYRWVQQIFPSAWASLRILAHCCSLVAGKALLHIACD